MSPRPTEGGGTPCGCGLFVLYRVCIAVYEKTKSEGIILVKKKESRKGNPARVITHPTKGRDQGLWLSSARVLKKKKKKEKKIRTHHRVGILIRGASITGAM